MRLIVHRLAALFALAGCAIVASANPPAPSHPADAMRDFHAFDTNRDGMVQPSELPAGHALVRAWATYDLDTSSSLSQSEFDAFVLASAGIDGDGDEGD